MLSIHTYGYIDAVFYSLTALKEVIATELMTGFLKFCVGIGVITAGIKGLATNNPKACLRPLIASIIIFTFFNWQENMIIKDHVTKRFDTVDNLPALFVIPVGLLEEIGCKFLKEVEKWIKPPGAYLQYSDYGSNFAASLVTDSKNWYMQDPVLVDNMDQFIQRCIVNTAAIGNEFTHDDVKESNDIWGDLVPKMKDGIRGVSIYNDDGQKTVMGCKTAATSIKKRLEKEIRFTQSPLLYKLFATAGDQSVLDRSFDTPEEVRRGFLNRNIKIVFSDYLGQKTNAETTMRQIMMLHAFSRYANYGTSKAIQQQETSWSLSGKVATYYVPMMLVIFKCISYIGFLFILPIVILTGNIAAFRGYFILIVSFQLYPIISSILNMFVDLFTSNSFKAIVNAGGVKISTLSTVHEASDMITNVASSMQMSVPIFSYMLVSYGWGSMGQLYNAALSATGLATSSTTSELTSGNRSYDNISQSNLNSYKSDLSSSYKADSGMYEFATGAVYKQSASGDEYITSGKGFTEHSGSKINYKIENSAQGIARAEISEQSTKVETAQESYQKNLTKAMESSRDLIDTMSSNFNQDSSSSFSKALQNHQRLSTAIEKAKQDSTEQGISLGSAVLKLFEGKTTNSNGHRYVDDKVLSELFDFTQNKDVKQSLAEHTNVSDNFKKSLASTLSSHQTYNRENQKLRSLHTNFSEMESTGAFASKDITENIFKQVAEKSGQTSEKVKHLLEKGDEKTHALAREEYMRAVKQNHQALESGEITPRYRKDPVLRPLYLPDYSFLQKRENEEMDKKISEIKNSLSSNDGLDESGKEFVGKYIPESKQKKVMKAMTSEDKQEAIIDAQDDQLKKYEKVSSDMENTYKKEAPKHDMRSPEEKKQAKLTANVLGGGDLKKRDTILRKLEEEVKVGTYQEATKGKNKSNEEKDNQHDENRNKKK